MALNLRESMAVLTCSATGPAGEPEKSLRKSANTAALVDSDDLTMSLPRDACSVPWWGPPFVSSPTIMGTWTELSGASLVKFVHSCYCLFNRYLVRPPSPPNNTGRGGGRGG